MAGTEVLHVCITEAVRYVRPTMVRTRIDHLCGRRTTQALLSGLPHEHHLRADIVIATPKGKDRQKLRSVLICEYCYWTGQQQSQPSLRLQCFWVSGIWHHKLLTSLGT